MIDIQGGKIGNYAYSWKGTFRKNKSVIREPQGRGKKEEASGIAYDHERRKKARSQKRDFKEKRGKASMRQTAGRRGKRGGSQQQQRGVRGARTLLPKAERRKCLSRISRSVKKNGSRKSLAWEGPVRPPNVGEEKEGEPHLVD